MIAVLDNLGSIGVSKDAVTTELDPAGWTDALNVRFTEGYAQNFGGHGQVFGTPSVAPYFAMPYSTATARNFLYGSLAALYSVDSAGTHTNITRAVGGAYAATADAKWTGAVLGGVAILNNPADTPQQYGGSGAAANLTSWPANTTARSIRAFRSHLLALNVTKAGVNYPHMVKWSHPADPGSVPSSWDTTDPTKDAGEFDLDDDPTVIVDGAPLGGAFVVYKEGAVYALEYIGPQYIFSKRKLFSSQGALATNCIAEIPGAHCVLGQGDLYVHSGGEPKSVVDQRLRRWLVQNTDTTNYKRCWVASNPAMKEVWAGIVTPGGTSATLALVWNWQYDTTQIREIPSVAHGASGIVDFATADSWDADAGTWDADTSAWDSSQFATTAGRLVMASAANTKMYLAEIGNQFDTSAMFAYVRRQGLSFGDPSRVKLLSQIRPLIEAPYGTQITVKAGAAMDQASAPTWISAQTFTVGVDQKVDCLVSGRFLALGFESSANAQWRFKRADLDVKLAGSW